jgi:hypothetical protein
MHCRVSALCTAAAYALDLRFSVQADALYMPPEADLTEEELSDAEEIIEKLAGSDAAEALGDWLKFRANGTDHKIVANLLVRGLCLVQSTGQPLFAPCWRPAGWRPAGWLASRAQRICQPIDYRL